MTEILTSDEHPAPTSPSGPSAPSRRAVLAGFVAAVGVAAGGGYALGATRDTPPPSAVPEPLTPAGPLGLPGRATADALAPEMSPYGYGRTVFSPSGLADDPARHEAWAFDPEQSFREATVVAAARVFGVRGEARKADGQWVVGDLDGTSPSVQLQPDGWSSLSFYDPRVSEKLNCYDATEPRPEEGGSADGSAGDDSGSSDPAPDSLACEGPGLDKAAARSRSLALLSDLGVDTSSVEVQTYSDPGMPSTYVRVQQVVDGTAVDAGWDLSFVGEDLGSFYGPMAPLVSLGQYATIGAATAVARLNDPRFGAAMFGGPVPLAKWNDTPVAVAESDGDQRVAAPPMAGAVASGVATAAPSGTPPTAPLPGAPIPWPVQQVSVTSATATLTQQWLANGAVVLLPSYRLGADDEMVWVVVSVRDDQLDFSTS